MAINCGTAILRVIKYVTRMCRNRLCNRISFRTSAHRTPHTAKPNPKYTLIKSDLYITTH